VIDGRFEGESLSGEEIRGLLGEEDSTDEKKKSPLRIHVLLASRSEEDADLLRGRLECHGAVVTQVRNPFSALDQLRRARYEGVVSDVELWAGEGSLLMDRVLRSESAVPVLFVGGTTGPPPGGLRARLLQAGAWDLLPRPLETGSLEKTVLDFVSHCAGARSRRPPAPRQKPAGAAGPDRETAETPTRPSEDGSRAELLWLRFFFHAQKGLHCDPPLESRARVLAQAALEHLQPRAVSIAVEGAEGVTACVLGRQDQDPEGLLEEIVAAGKDPGAAGGVAIRTGERGHRKSFTLLDLPDDVRRAAEPFLADLRALLDPTPEVRSP
jgi:CheY-like chemotaxis protein